MSQTLVELQPRYANWEVIGTRVLRKKHYFVLCRCVCGSEKEIRYDHLFHGDSQGCITCSAYLVHGGCVGGVVTPTYVSWKAAKARCLNPKHMRFKSYGAKGVTICNRWRDSFKNFLEDMGERPEGCSLGRIGDCGNYEPANCRWMSHEEQLEHAAIKRLMKQAGYTF